MTETSIKAAVREKYGQAAQRVGCCGTTAGTNPISSNLYSDQETGALPEAAVAASLGCGNPTALAELKPGETVLDLGSGGGIDVLLSARRVGPARGATKCNGLRARARGSDVLTRTRRPYSLSLE
jgi:arsenite methyltransferase